MTSILLVEDSAPDAMLIRQALIEAGVPGEVEVVTDGEQALARLRGGPAPDLMLLDLNLPRKDGREVLAEIKEDPKLRLIPVVVLTTSEAERDLVKSYDLHANAYVVKPIDLDQFTDVVRGIKDFWLTIVKLPPKAEND